MQLKIKSGETLLFVGDSITDCGRNGSVRMLGSGYVKLFSDLVMSREPKKRINILNTGISGHGVLDLRNRWSDDVLRYKPDWLSILIGINDCSRQYSQKGGNYVPPKLFRELYDELLARTAKALPKCRLLLLDPFYMSRDDCADSYRYGMLKLIPEYQKAVHALSRKYKTRLVKTHEIFQGILKYYPTAEICPEPVHPNTSGQLVIAEAVYAALAK